MDSNVSHYAFDPDRDEYEAYESTSQPRPGNTRRRQAARPLAGQIRFEAPWMSIPGIHSSLKYISLDQIEFEMERAARRQED